MLKIKNVNQNISFFDMAKVSEILTTLKVRTKKHFLFFKSSSRRTPLLNVMQTKFCLKLICGHQETTIEIL